MSHQVNNEYWKQLHEAISNMSGQERSNLFNRLLQFIKVLAENLDNDTRQHVEVLIKNASQAHDDNDIAEALNIIDSIAFMFDGGSDTEAQSDEFLQQLVVDAFENGSERDLASLLNDIDRANAEKSDEKK